MFATGGQPAVAAVPVPFDSRVRAKLSADQTVVTGTWSIIEFDEVDYDGKDELNDAIHAIEITDDGTYSIKYSIALQDLDLGKEAQCQIWVDAAVVAGGSDSLGNAVFTTNRLNASVDMNLLAGDIVKLKLYHNQGADRIIYPTTEGGSVLCLRRIA